MLVLDCWGSGKCNRVYNHLLIKHNGSLEEVNFGCMGLCKYRDTENHHLTHNRLILTPEKKRRRNVLKRVSYGVGGGVANMPPSQFECSPFRAQLEYQMHHKSFLGTFPSG